MKNVLLLVSGLIVTMTIDAQSNVDSWKISWNKKLILQSSKTDETGNVRQIKSADLKKKYSLEISYKEGDSKKLAEWNRSFMLFDESDTEILRKDSTRTWKISATELKKLFGDKKKIKLYTIAIPTDPNLAARVRVRRVHLCTLQLH